MTVAARKITGNATLEDLLAIPEGGASMNALRLLRAMSHSSHIFEPSGVSTKAGEDHSIDGSCSR